MISLLFLLVLLSPSYGVRTSIGLSIKLIHPTSPESPFYNGNLTKEERFRELVHDSIARAHIFASNIKHNNNNNNNRNSTSRRLLKVRPRLRVKYNKGILVDVKLGTVWQRIPYSYFLDMDTGSELTWLQCEGCSETNKCIPQLGEPFPNSRSTSYKRLSYGDNNLCYPNLHIGGVCTYHVGSEDRLQSKGYLSTERFAFASTYSKYEKLPSLVFGCGTENEGPASGEEAGTFGLGWGPRSIVSQLGYITDERFSYCFPHVDQVTRATYSYLTFGNDIKHQGNFQQTALVQVQAQPHYYLRLTGIAIAGQRLNIPTRELAIQEDGTGGMVIDTGSYVTHLTSTAYRELVLVLDAYMEHIGNMRMNTRDEKDKCYIKGQGPQSHQFPHVILYFAGHTFMEIYPQNLFFDISNSHMYCLAIQESVRGVSILGSYQQSDMRFIYDRGQKLLFFRPENCGG